MKALDGIDIAGDAADQIAGAFLIVIGEREPLDVRVQRSAQIMHDPLADAGGNVFFAVGTERVEDGDDEDGDGGIAQDVQTILADRMVDEVVQPAGAGLGSDYVVENDFERPRLQQVRDAFADHGEKPEDE